MRKVALSLDSASSAPTGMRQNLTRCVNIKAPSRAVPAGTLRALGISGKIEDAFSELPVMKSHACDIAWLAAAFLTSACADRAKTPETVQAGATAAPALAAKLSAAPDKFVGAGSVRLRYRVAGPAGADSATPIVFIHGYSRSLEDMLALADSFAPSHRVIAYDVRGFGQSSKSGDIHRYGAAMDDDVIALLDSLKIQRAHLVGHSMGALIAGNVAARYPQRVASASLVAGPFYADSAAFARVASRWVSDLEHGAGLRNFLKWLFPGMPDSVARGGSADAMAHNDSVTMISTMRAFGGLAVTSDRAAAATVPILIAAGGGDPLAPLSRRLAKQWPHARLIEVAGVDHVAIIGRPEVIAGIRGMVH